MHFFHFFNAVGECKCGLSQSVISIVTTSTSTSTKSTITPSPTSINPPSADVSICSSPTIINTSSSSGAVGYAVSGVLGALLLLSGIYIAVTSVLIWKYRKIKYRKIKYMSTHDGSSVHLIIIMCPFFQQDGKPIIYLPSHTQQQEFAVSDNMVIQDSLTLSTV